MYADLLLISASVLELQRMLDMCGSVGIDVGINFNSSKCSCLVIGPNSTYKPEPMIINRAGIKWSDNVKYLGVVVKTGKIFSVDLTDVRRKFYVCKRYFKSV